MSQNDIPDVKLSSKSPKIYYSLNLHTTTTTWREVRLSKSVVATMNGIVYAKFLDLECHCYQGFVKGEEFCFRYCDFHFS